MRAPFIIDTNVVVAGLLTGQADAPTARVLDGTLSAAFLFMISSALLAEYRDVTGHLKLRRLLGLSPDEVETLMVELAQQAIVLTPVTTGPAPDAGDPHLWELLAARGDLMLVTGDKPLLESEMGARILTPGRFVAGWPG